MNNKKKKIAFVIGALSSGGAERVISTLSNALIDRYDIIIITFVRSTPFYNLNDKVNVINCLETITTPNSIYQSINLNYRLTKQIFKILKKEKVSISIGFITSANILTTIASKLRGIPCIISERNNPMIENVPKFWVVFRKHVYPLANRVILQTAGVKRFYKGKLKEEKIDILPNPISAGLSNSRNNNVKRKNIILSVGRLDKNKCHDMIIKAFKNVRPRNWKLLIAGTGPMEAELKELIKDNHLQDSVEILGKVKEIEKLYNSAGIFVTASKTEGFPNALLEAMSFGIPTIATDCDFGPSEIIENNKNGFLIPVGDQYMLEKRLNHLVNNEKIRCEFSKNAELATKRFHVDAVVTQWEAVINSLI